ncbi:fimbria/pilus outer membrane usher protein [Diaphorobacter caeni]|uniref:fimbria/pilus outer membrane usher protein n=1 Tax=Diaphorobacter caeni TaxID=2784387 RepID=UPI00188F632A|nr:fimbria/pilus outer membrane usher protein [Diaphorobacter caeni]MBF5002811.1 fimbrial biogenesis outer membrane usher protein [Diaphorobacter caeni]
MTSAALAVAFGTLPAFAQSGAFRESDLPMTTPAKTRADARAAPIAMTLATQLNTRDFGMLPARMRAGGLEMRRSTLTTLGLQPAAMPVGPVSENDDEWIRLDQITGMQVQFNMALQSLTLQMPFEHLNWARTLVDTSRQKSQQATSAPGLLVNYDLYASNFKNSHSLSALTEWRAFSQNSVLSNTMSSRWVRSDATDSSSSPSNFSQVRLDTTYALSLPDSMISVRVGDTTTGAQPWSRATRIGGIQIARNFGLQPYFSTSPIPALMGTSALPSAVELYINGIKQYQGSLNAGPFALNVPTGINGSGLAQVVLTDAYGRSTTVQYNIYGTTQLLSKGLSNWSAELGWVRRNYGEKSFSYGSDPALSGSYSYGWSDRLTLQSHAEATSGLANAGGGAMWSANRIGVFSAALATSQSHGDSGALVQLGHDWNNQSFSTSIQATRASAGYRDTASLYDSQRQRASGRAMVGYNDPLLGSFNIGALYLQNFGDSAQRYVTAGWSRSLNGRGMLNFNVNHNLDDSRRSTMQFVLSWYLDGRINAGTSVSRQNKENAFNAYANQSRPADGGWGWSTAAQHDGSGTSGQARVDYLASKFEANASITSDHGNTSTAFGAAGSLVFMDSHLFASRRIYDSFAVVSTNGIPDVPIKRDNTLIGHTNSSGRMLITDMGAYRNNKLSIDALALPAQLKVPTPDQNIVPTDRAGTLVKFDIERIHSASVILVDENAKPLPLGSRAQATGSKTTAPTPLTSIVGHDGMTYFENVDARARIQVYLAGGGQCQAEVVIPEGETTDIPLVGPVVCKKVP